jgi:hypothetical protein
MPTPALGALLRSPVLSAASTAPGSPKWSTTKALRSSHAPVGVPPGSRQRRRRDRLGGVATALWGLRRGERDAQCGEREGL